jgi:segregation and condensation protein A
VVKPKLTLVSGGGAAPEAVPLAVAASPEQSEMPFAVVHGEPVTVLPRDLYIPPQALEVFLEAFEGPLDLLLYLIRRQNLNVLDLPIAEIAKQYTQYIDLMAELQLELAGEYLLMAATLADIKSRMLLPQPASDGDEADPRADLVRRLQQYERYKKAALDIDTLPRQERDVWQASADLRDRPAVRTLPQIDLQEMLLAFRDVALRAQMFSHHHVKREPLSVRERMSDVLAALEQGAFVEFAALFRPEEGRMGVTVTFIALLELMREGLIEVVQAELLAPLHVRRSSTNRRLELVAVDGITISPQDGVPQGATAEEIAALDAPAPAPAQDEPPEEPANE